MTDRQIRLLTTENKRLSRRIKSLLEELQRCRSLTASNNARVEILKQRQSSLVASHAQELVTRETVIAQLTNEVFRLQNGINAAYLSLQFLDVTSECDLASEVPSQLDEGQQRAIANAATVIWELESISSAGEFAEQSGNRKSTD